MTIEKEQTKPRYLKLDELAELIDNQAHDYLHMTGQEFIDRDRRGELDDTYIAHKLRMLVSLAEGNKRPGLLRKIRGRFQ